MYKRQEYDNTLRLVTTVTHNVGSSSQSNSVYVLDADLKTIGKIEDLAKNEQVYSARFFGDTGYFVTYEQTDPLFSVDFSDPENPKILGKLKIPGFSEYLHFYSDNLLLGIGMDTDENGITNGVKMCIRDRPQPVQPMVQRQITILRIRQLKIKILQHLRMNRHQSL